MANSYDPYAADASYNRPDNEPNIEEANEDIVEKNDKLAEEQTSPEAAPEANVETANYGDVPEGSISVVLDWVGDDKSKAQAALQAEHGADKPRKTLIEKLEEIAE